jgi:SAM-dependent methyltransferase
MSEIVDRGPLPSTSGKIFHWARAYDLLLRVFWGRSEQSYRDKVVHLAGLTSGERVLDVGCGTGTLAITAKWRVGQTGKVIGIDASPEIDDGKFISRRRPRGSLHDDAPGLTRPRG